MKRRWLYWLAYFLLGVATALAIFVLPFSCDAIFGTKANGGFTNEELNDFEKHYLEADYFVQLVATVTVNDQTYPTLLAGSVIEVKGKYYILTVAHIEEPQERLQSIKVFFRNQPPEQAALLGYDRHLDIAMLGFTNPNFSFYGRTACLGNANSLNNGDQLMILGLDNERTLGHRITYLWSYFCDDLLISSAVAKNGYSGGPMINQAGEVVGVVNSGFDNIFSDRPTLNFGTKMEYIRPLLQDMINGMRR